MEIATVAGVQMDIELKNVDRNLTRMEDKYAEARQMGADLIVFPECAVTGYCFDSLEEALPFGESLPGPSSERMASVCAKHGGYMVYGFLERDGDALFNACALVGAEGVVGGYRKVHLPYLGIDRFTTPGDRPFAVHQAGELRVGMNICYDAAFPEASRVMSLAGADIIVLPTNWPPGAETTAQFLINARALENNVFQMAVNRVGEERGFPFIGQSKICGPDGRNLSAADHTDETIISAQLELTKARNKRVVRVAGKHEIHRFDDRRPELYGTIAAPGDSD